MSKVTWTYTPSSDLNTVRFLSEYYSSMSSQMITHIRTRRGHKAQVCVPSLPLSISIQL